MKLKIIACLAAGIFSLWPAGKKAQAAIVTELTGAGGHWQVALDFVEIRDCNCDAGFEVINANKKLRHYRLDKQVKIRLLKNAGEYRSATVEDFAAARDGKNFGWPFGKDTPFEFIFDKANEHVLEMRQIYFP